MTVQIQPAKPKDEHNGLVDIESEILAAPRGEKVYGIVTYERVKRVEDESKDETYPVLRVRHIEPIRDELEQEAIDLQAAAYRARTGQDTLDLDFEGDDDEPEAA